MTAPTAPETDLFDELAAESATLEDGWIGTRYYLAVPVTDVTDGDLVLPAGWGTAFRVLGDLNADETEGPAVVALDDVHVLLRWDCGPNLDTPWPPEPSTVFRRDEKVLVARW